MDWAENILSWGTSFISALQAFRSHWLDQFFIACSFLADEKFFLVLLPAIWWWKGARYGAVLVSLVVLTGILNGLLKAWVALPRPFLGGEVVAVIFVEGMSFPSGHAQTGAAVWSALYFLWPRRAVALVASAAIFLSGLSRSYLGVHYPSDVVAGWAIGTMLAAGWVSAAAPACGWLDQLRAWQARWPLPVMFVNVGLPLALLLLFPNFDGYRIFTLWVGFALTLPLWEGKLPFSGARLVLAILGGISLLFALYYWGRALPWPPARFILIGAFPALYVAGFRWLLRLRDGGRVSSWFPVFFGLAMGAPPAFALPNAGLITERLEARFAADAGVGAVAAVVRDGKLTYLQGFGLADREQGRRVDPHTTLFRWASLSKGVTATALVLASREGKLDFATDIKQYYADYHTPDFYLPPGCRSLSCAERVPYSERVVTVHMLLAHTAGFPHYENTVGSPMPPIAATNDPAVNTGIEWAMPYLLATPLVSIPGRTTNYSSFGYNLAGVVLEKATGEKFWDYVRARIARPSGMPSFRPDYHWISTPDNAAGYMRNSEGAIVREGDDDVSWKLPGGGFLSTGRDFAQYCGALLGEAVLSDAEKYATIWKAQVDNRGYGFFLGERNGRPFVRNDGSQQQAKTALLAYPEEELCFVFMTNSTYLDPKIYVELIEDAYRKPSRD